MIDEAHIVGDIDLDPIDKTAVTIQQCIRSKHRHTLLAYVCNQGLLLHDRRSGLQHILSWSNLRAILPPIEEK